MPSVPQLLDEDVQAIRSALREFLSKTEATAALLAAEGGFILFQEGDTSEFDSTVLGALAANAYSATQAIAQVLNETGFATIYQQGVRFSILVAQVNRAHSLIIIFPANAGVGAVKYFAAFAIQVISAQLNRARDRAPEGGFDLALLNMADASELFRAKSP